MIKVRFLLVIGMIYFGNVDGQDIIIEFKSDYNKGALKFKGKRVKYKSNNEAIQEYNYSISASAKVYKFIYLKASIGTNDYYNLIDIDWYPLELDPTMHSLLSWIDVTQNYIEFLPEIRFRLKVKELKGLSLIGFLNGGTGFNQIRHSEHTHGIYSRKPGTTFDENEFPRFDGKYKYFTSNIGFVISYKSFGVLLEYGIRESKTTKSYERNPGIPGIGIDQRMYRVGFIYSIN